MYTDYKSRFKERCQKDRSNKRYKVKMDISSIIMKEIFRFSKNSVPSLRSACIYNVHCISESTVYLVAKI